MKRFHDRRRERESFLIQGVRVSFQPDSSTVPDFDHRGVLEDAFWSFGSNFEQIQVDRSDEKSGSSRKRKHGLYGHGSFQVLAAFLQSSGTDIILSEELEPETINKIQTILERAYSSPQGLPLLSDLGIPKNADPFEFKLSPKQACLREKKKTGKIMRCAEEEDLLHEFFVSTYFVNHLRMMVPNFQLCYGGVKILPCQCFPAQSSPEKQREFGTCLYDKNSLVDYLLLEKLDGYPLAEKIKSCTVKEYLNWLVQIVLALELGVVNFGFTHYNLDLDAVVIVPGETEIKIKYWFRNQIILVSTKSVAVMKNFEFSHVKSRSGAQPDELVINGSEHFGALGYEKLGIYHNETRPFYDLYKLVFSSLRIAQNANPKLFSELRKVTKFFGYSFDRDLVKTLDTEENLGYIYSAAIGKQEKTRSLAEFFTFLLEIYPELAETVISAQAYSEVKTLQCSRFCPLQSFEEALGEDPKNPLFFLGIRGCLERRWGLLKRKQEYERFLQSNSELGDEYRDISTELEGFEKLMVVYGNELYLSAREKLENYALETDVRIGWFNNEVETVPFYKTYPAEKHQSYLKSIETRLLRKKSAINGRIVVLVRDLSLLNQFAELLDPAPERLTIEIDPLLSLDFLAN